MGVVDWMLLRRSNQEKFQYSNERKCRARHMVSIEICDKIYFIVRKHHENFHSYILLMLMDGCKKGRNLNPKSLEKLIIRKNSMLEKTKKKFFIPKKNKKIFIHNFFIPRHEFLIFIETSCRVFFSPYHKKVSRIKNVNQEDHKTKALAF